jgi:hypothetical protein
VTDGRKQTFGDIWIGDVLLAWKALNAVTPADRRRIAAALGFGYDVRQPGVGGQVSPVPEGPRPSATTIRSPLRVEAARPGEPTPESPGSVMADDLYLLFEMEPMHTAGSSAPAWALVTDTVPGDDVRHLRHTPPLEPLFTPDLTRATLAALSATLVEEGPIDFKRVLGAICQTRPLTALPRQSVRTLRRGVQLLIDENEGFSFHQRDVDDIAASVAAVAGRDRTQVLRFTGVPTRGVRPKRFDPPAAWPLPAPGTPIVVVSDFGLVRRDRSRGASSTTSDWERVATIARAAGCALLGLVPLAPARWPLPLRRLVRLCRWDRRATTALAQRVARGELG